MFNRRGLPSFSSTFPLVGLILFCLVALPDAHNAQDRGQGTKSPTEARPEQRIALVIGNADYKEAKLTNPINDARDMAAALRGVGFEVISGEDRSLRQMKELVVQFGQKLRSGGIGVFYFAGHGVQVAGKNYLIPVGAEINSEFDVEFESVELGYVLAQLEDARNRLNVVILDACRNNPYARSFRSGSRGLASVRNAPSGTLIAYATAADDLASDGGNARNGLYTGELLAQLKTPGLTLEQVFRRTRSNVTTKSNGRQVPYEYTSVVGEDFYFIPPNALPPPVSSEQQAWERAKQIRTQESVRGFLSLYPNSPFEKEARALLAVLVKENPTIAANPPAVSAPATSVPTSLTPIIPLPRGVNPSALAIHRFTTASVDANGKVTKFDGTPTQQYTEDFGNGVWLEMVAVKGGTFSMGSATGLSDEKPVHQVTVSNFWIGKYELTQAQWHAVMGNNPSHFKGSNLPVESVSWKDAKEFCRKLNAKLSLKDEEDYRLPTEAEWEYAARASTATPFAFGETITPEMVNYDGNLSYGQAPKGAYRQHPVAVGSLGHANAFGLFDMHGNMFEWCEDQYREYPSGAVKDLSSQASSLRRVLRGGGFRSDPVGCRLAWRTAAPPRGRNDDIGFRLARTVQ